MPSPSPQLTCKSEPPEEIAETPDKDRDIETIGNLFELSDEKPTTATCFGPYNRQAFGASGQMPDVQQTSATPALLPDGKTTEATVDVLKGKTTETSVRADDENTTNTADGISMGERPRTRGKGKQGRKKRNKGPTEVFHCEICKKRYTTETEYKQHLESSFHKDNDPEVRFQCEYCHESFNTIRDHGYHTFKHTGVHRFKCEKCGRGHNSEAQFRKHVKRHRRVQRRRLLLGF